MIKHVFFKSSDVLTILDKYITLVAALEGKKKRNSLQIPKNKKFNHSFKFIKANRKMH